MDVIGSLLNEAWNEALEADDVDGADIEQEITFDERSAKRGRRFGLLSTRPTALLVLPILRGQMRYSLMRLSTMRFQELMNVCI